MTTLKIKNEKGGELKIETGGDPVKLAAGAEADLSEKELKSQGFVKALEEGSVSFVNVAKPNKDQITLARAILPSLVKAAGGRIGNLKSRFEQSQKELLKQRDSFIKAWNVADANLTAAQKAVPGWPALQKAVKNLLLDTKVDDLEVTEARNAIKAIQKEIGDLKKEDLAVSGRTREVWFADRLAKEQTLKDAEAALSKVDAEKADPLAEEVATVDTAVAALAGLKKDKAIGPEIAEFGK